MANLRRVEVVTGQTAHATPGTAKAVSVPLKDLSGYYVTPAFVLVQSNDTGTPNAIFAVGTITPATPSTPATVDITCSEASTPFGLIAFDTRSLV